MNSGIFQLFLCKVYYPLNSLGYVQLTIFCLCMFSWGKDVIKSGLFLNRTSNSFSISFARFSSAGENIGGFLPGTYTKQPRTWLPRASHSPTPSPLTFCKLYLLLLDPRCCSANCRQMQWIRFPSRQCNICSL